MKTNRYQRISNNARGAMAGLALTFALLPGPVWGQAQQIACGQTINSSIASAAQTVSYTFSANAGEVVTILALGQALNAVADIYSPSESRVASCTNNFTGPVTLTSAGTYTIRVHSDNGLSTGAYGISLTFLTGRCGAPFIWGLPATRTVGSLAEVDSYSFHGNAGEAVIISASGTNLTTASFVSDPAGTILANWLNGAAALNLASTGTYTVGVYPYYISSTGAYTASLTFTKLVPASYRLAVGRTNGAAGLTLWGQVGHMTALQFATELPANPWTPLTNFSLPWSPYRFVDWTSTNSPRRFYRTVQ